METSEWMEQTDGLCPTCLQTVPARLFVSDGRVWMEQNCIRHGMSRALLASDATEYLRLRQYVPPRLSLPSSILGCCGSDSACCGAGEVNANTSASLQAISNKQQAAAHYRAGEADVDTPASSQSTNNKQQATRLSPPTCVLLLEITLACNLRCPTCYADARGHDFMPLETARERLDAFFRTQKSLDVLMLSGGEPTIHPHFADILALALQYPIGRILVNTNGLRLEQSDALLDLLAAQRDRVELFFSFSSFRSDVHVRLYGRDLIAQKQRALQRAQAKGLFVTLVATLERGINDDEIGDLYHYSLSLDNINGLTFQPVMSAGRYEHEFPAHNRMTLTDVLRELECQTNGALRTTDFVGLPCSHPDCCALTYGFLDAQRETIMPLPRHLDVARYLDLFADRISFAGMLGSAARRVWSDVAHLRARQTLRDLAALFLRGGLRDVLPLIGQPEQFGKRVFRIVVKPFMDAHTYDHKRIEQCCTKILNEQGEAISFCEYNVFHRGRKASESTIPLTLKR